MSAKSELPLIEARPLLLSQDPGQRSHQNVWRSRLVNQLTGSTGTFQLTEAAVNNERNVSLLQPGAHIGRREATMQDVVDDRGGEPGLFALGQRIRKRARYDNAGSGVLEAVGNVERDHRFVLDDQN